MILLIARKDREMKTKSILCCVSLAFACLAQVGCALSSDGDTEEGREQKALGTGDETRRRTRLRRTRRRTPQRALGSSWAANRAATSAASRAAGACPVVPGSRGRAKRARRTRALAIRMAAMAAPRRNSSAAPIDVLTARPSIRSASRPSWARRVSAFERLFDDRRRARAAHAGRFTPERIGPA